MKQTSISSFLLRAALWLATTCAAGPALAYDYVFPTDMPAGCSASGSNYSCGALPLNNSDTIAIAAPLPATITVNGDFTVNRATVNAGGLASNLTLVVTGTLSVGNGGEVNAQQVTAASVTNSGGRAIFGGSVSTSGTLSLGNSASLAQCAQSTGMAAITLGNNATVGSVCCGALGACSSSCVVNNSGNAMPALCSTPPSPSTPGRFNAFDTGTAAGSVSGVVRTKEAGSAFTLAVVALNAAGTSLVTSFAGSVKVELLDSRDNSGALSSSTGCRASWALAAGTASSTLVFAASDLGRKNITLTVTDAWKDARLRISYPATGTATAVGCSNDRFAIRPAAFASFSATDATSLTAGIARVLDNTALSGGNVHKAGQPFTLRATAVNGAATPAITPNYTDAPSTFVSSCVGGACTATLGTLSLNATAAAGVINTATATYTEAGAFSLRLEDSSFAAVDAADGSTLAERSFFSPTITVGRFVPDHFAIVAGLTPPRFRTFNSTCATRSFTYLGQPFGYESLPQATVEARNATGDPTGNYPNTKLSALAITQTYTPLAAATPGLDINYTTPPSVIANGNGTASLATQASDTLTMVRPTSTPLAPFNASIALAWSVTDSSETATPGNGSITTTTPLTMSPIAFDAGNEFRYGMLKLGSAYGSERINLAVAVETQYLNSSSSFVTNADDHCTTLATSSLALGNYRSNLAACETAPGAASLTFSSGRALLRMLPPGAGNSGSADLTLNLGTTASGQQCASVGATPTTATTANQPWLQRKGPGAATYDQNPSARISFGQYRSPMIHLREVY